LSCQFDAASQTPRVALLRRSILVCGQQGTSRLKSAQLKTFSVLGFQTLAGAVLWRWAGCGEGEYTMNRLYPEHARRLRRVSLLLLVATVLAGGTILLVRPGVDAPVWLWLPTYVSSCVLGTVAIVLLFSVLRELRYLRQLRYTRRR